MRRSASHNPVIAGETTKPKIPTNTTNPFNTTFAAIDSPASDARNLMLESFPSAAHNKEKGNPCIRIANRNIGNVTGLVNDRPKFLNSCGNTEYRTTSALSMGLRATPRWIVPNSPTFAIFLPAKSDSNVLPNRNARMEPQVLPTKLPSSPLLKPNAIPAAVSTTIVGRPHTSQKVKPKAYVSRPLSPFDAMSFNLSMMAFRNLSLSKKALIVSQWNTENKIAHATIETDTILAVLFRDPSDASWLVDVLDIDDAESWLLFLFPTENPPPPRNFFRSST